MPTPVPANIAAMLELERRGQLPPSLQEQLKVARDQGVVKGGSTTEGERTAAFLGTRLEGSLAAIQRVTEADPAAAKPTFMVEGVRGVFGETAANLTAGASRQQVEAAQLDALDAALTLGTGAAYTADQMKSYRKAYFPQLGDDDATVKAKEARFAQLVQAARVKAGSAAGNIDTALAKTAAATGDAPETVVDSATAAGMAIDGAVDKAAGIDPPDPNAPLRVDIRPQGDPRLNDPAFRASLEKLLNSDASGDEIRAFWSANGGAPQNASPEGATTSAPRGKGGALETTEAGLRGVLDTVSLGFGDELQAVGDTIAKGGEFRDNLLRQRATDAYDREYSPYARAAGQIAGGFALPLGGARSAAALGRTGAAYGGAYGLGSADGSLGERVQGAALGATTGAVAGAALGAGGNALAARFGRGGAGGGGNADGRALVEAAGRQRIDMMPADVAGPLVRGATSLGSVLPGSMASIRNAARRTNDQAQAARDRIADGVGTPVEYEAAGEAAKRGAKAFRERTSARGDTQYKRAERLSGGARVEPVSARMSLDRHIAELSETPGGAEGLAQLQALRADLNGAVTVTGFRNMRTSLRDRFISQNLRGSDLERRVNQVIDAANEDVVRGLRAQGKGDAARAYAVADRYWRNRLATIDETLEPIVGNHKAKNGGKSAEEIVKALQSASKGNAARLASFVRALPPEEAATVRATLITQLGRAGDGAQDAQGRAFSLDVFLTHWNQMRGSRERLFDAASVAALNDLAIVANGAKAAGRYRNFSNTGISVGGLATGSTGLLDFATLGKTLAAQYGAGRLLASPAFARWLAKAPTAADAAGHLRQLGVIAARQPAISVPLIGLQRRLAESVGQVPQRAAAEKEGDDPRPQIPQRRELESAR